MPPSDKIKENNSNTGEDQTQETSKVSAMNTTPQLSSSSASDFTIPGTIASIPLITASLPTLKCSINDQMKTFDPGEDSGNERLSSNQFGNSVCTTKSSSNLIKGSNKNYKAGSKINKLADMLAKRSQNVVEVSQSNPTDIISNTNSVATVEESVSLKNVSDIMNLKKCLDDPIGCFEKTATNNELGIFKKSRRKSVPNQSYNLNHMHPQSTSTACSDFSKLFLADENGTPEFNALGVSLITLQTDESTKRKAIRKNLKNVELTLILPEKKRRSYARNVFNNKILENQCEDFSKEMESTEEISKNFESPNEIVTSSVSSPTHSVSSIKEKKESKEKKRKSKKLVETSTQTGDEEFSVESNELDDYYCLYCTQTFSLESDCRAHEKTHIIRSTKQFIMCQYCSKKLPSLHDLKLHCCQRHPNKYSYCIKCDYRFSTKDKLYSHNKEVHFQNILDSKRNCTIGKVSIEPFEEKKEETEEKQTDRKVTKQSQIGGKADLKIDVSFDTTKKSSVSPRNIQKCSPKETKTEEQLLEMEMLFYSQLSGNIQENLTNHLDGKIDKNGNPVRMEQDKELVDTHAKVKSSNVLSLASPNTGASDVPVSRAPSPYQTRSKTPNPLPPTAKKFKKLPNWQQKFWEKYNFPTNYRYEHRFWDKNYPNTEKSTFYLKDLSCLDIKTQLIMKESIKKLDSIKIAEENDKPLDKLKFPNYLALVPKENSAISHEVRNEPNKNVSELKGNQIKQFKPPGPEVPTSKTRRKLSTDYSSGKKQSERINSEGIKMITRSQSSIDLLKDDKEEDLKKKAAGVNASENQRMTLRRQTSLDNLKKNTESTVEKNSLAVNNTSSNTNDSEIASTSDLPELSGEWVRPRIYLCGACCMKFTNLWELEDHKWISHPNVWCTHYEFEDEKIENLFQISEDESRESNNPSSPSNLKLTDLYKRYLLPHGSLKTAKLVPSITFPEQCTKCKKSCMNSPELHKHMLDCGGDTSWFLTMYSSPMTIKRRWRPFGSRRRKQLGRRDLKRNLPSTPSIKSYPYRPRVRTKPGDMESIQKMLANLPEKRARRVINFDDIKTRSQATIRSNRLLRKRFKSTFATNFLKLKNLKQRRQLKQGKKEGSSKSATDASSESTPIGSPKRRNKLKEGLQILEDNSTEFSSENSLDSLTKSKKKGHVKTSGQSTQKNETKKLNKKKSQSGKTEKPNTRKNGATLMEKDKNKISQIKEEPSSIAELPSVRLEEVEPHKILRSQNRNSVDAASNVFIKDENNAETLTSDDKHIKKSSKKNKKKLQKGGGKIKNDQFVSSRSRTKEMLRQQAKEKTELLQRMKKKVQSSKRILENKESKNIESGKRRSLRLKFQQGSDFSNEVDVEAVIVNDKIVQNHLPHQSMKNSGDNLKPSKASNGKSFNEEEEEEEAAKETENNCETVSLVRRSSRTSLLRNSLSLEEKTDIKSVTTSESEGESRGPLLRRNSSNSSRRLATSGVAEKLSRTKSSRTSNIDAASLPENSDTGERGRQTLRRNCVQNSESSLSSAVKMEPLNSNERNTNSDLEEMPILAKVEPIRGKTYVKNEQEIPVLMPVEKKQQPCSSPNERDGNKMNFQITKKRRNTTTEMSPIKIIKTGNSVSVEKAEKMNHVFASEDNSDGSSFRRVNKKKKMPDIYDDKIVPIEEKRRRSSTEKKYFLGICPGEIDKGKDEYNDESESDSEPLIALINQNQKTNPVNSFEVEEAPVLQVENVQALENKNSETPTEKFFKEDEKQVTLTENNFELSPVKEKSSELSDVGDSAEVCNSHFVEPNYLMKKKRSKVKSKKKATKKKVKRLTLALKEPTLRIEAKPLFQSAESLWTLKVSKESIEPEIKPTLEVSQPEQFTKEPELDEVTSVLPKRRSRRISKETKSTNEFIIDDPLILVDELWSELDSDSDSSKKKSKKGKKKFLKKKASEEKKTCDVNLEELLRNFGENKETGNSKKEEQPLPLVPVKIKNKVLRRTLFSVESIRKSLENRAEPKSYKRLSLKLFQFNKTLKNFGNRGWKLCDARKVIRKIENENKSNESRLPDLPFLATEIKENPVQVIQCRAQKSKTVKKGSKKPETKSQSSFRFKISLPLESISNIAVFNNNHLTELVVEEPAQGGSANTQVIAPDVNGKEEKESFESASEKENHVAQEEYFEMSDIKSKTKRSEVIDKIFYCEICKTYYYSCSQLKIHKQSNRHKLKESELQLTQPTTIAEEEEEDTAKKAENDYEVETALTSVSSEVSTITREPILPETVEAEKLNDDTLEMPILEGPFIENPMSSLEPVEPAPQIVPPMANLGFTQESLKDIQRAIGCTDEEMLILTLLGENTLEVENDILDLNSCKSTQSKNEKDSIENAENDSERANGILKIDLKQRMTSALSCLVNKAVFNLLRKYETVAKTSVNPEALTLLGKLSSFSRRKNILQLNDLLKKQKIGEPSVGGTVGSKDLDKKVPAVSYKYQCTICGNRFEKASTREFHISRTHRSKTKKLTEKTQIPQSVVEEEWNDSWNYDANDESLGRVNSSQFWCSDCGINFLSPQEVLQHQKMEHQAGGKEPERIHETGPLQSSTIGSSDEIIEEKKPKRRPKLFSTEELDQQRILANNELRKLDRKFAGKNKANKIKWGMDALRFTVEKENKVIVMEEKKEEDAEKPQNLDLIPKLNLSRTNNIPEFKVIQKNSLKNRFQKIIDNKLKRRSSHQLQEAETDDVETEVMLVPVVVKKKNKKFRRSKSKKDEDKKNVDVYDFNDSESENEPVVFSRVKKSSSSISKLKLVKTKETPSKNKADSTTKHLVPDDYDSEDSLPLSIVKKSKPDYEEDEKEEKISESGVERSDGILEQVEYLIEQLENETTPTKTKKDILEEKAEDDIDEGGESKMVVGNKEDRKEQDKDTFVTSNKGLRVSLTNKLLELQDFTTLKPQKESKDDDLNDALAEEVSKLEAEKPATAEPESNQSTFDEEDSIPLVHIYKKFDESKSKDEQKKSEETITDVPTIDNEDTTLFFPNDGNKITKSDADSPLDLEESLPPVFVTGDEVEKSNKSFETLNGNVIYCRNDSISDFESDLSNDEVVDSNYEKTDLTESSKDFIEVTEKEDVVIVCSKGDDKKLGNVRGNNKRPKSSHQKKDNVETAQKKKKRIPLLTATIEENNFRKSESPKLNKEFIVRKIWNRRKLLDEAGDDSVENIQNNESQTEIDKEFIMRKIWNRKKLDIEMENEKVEEKLEDVKINQTEVSDEVIIKCGPKTKTSPKRRKSRSSTNECAKETIMRKIWSGKCTFQTKAALKTYDSDMVPISEENEITEEQPKPKKRGRPSGFSSTKRSKTEDVEKDDEDDDLDSLLEEIEREQLEKAIRSEFLQLRRSDKGNVEILKEGSNPTVGLFAETSITHKKNVSDRKRKKLKKNRKHPRQSLLTRKRYLKKPIRRVFPTVEEKLYNENSLRTMSESVPEMRENFLEKKVESINLESKVKSRKHKKHRHKHHHHKHKHKKSKHHKCILNKHKNKYKFSTQMDVVETTDSFTILEKICQDIPNQIESESHDVKEKISRSKEARDTNDKIENLVSPFSFEDSTKDCEDDSFDNVIPGKANFQSGSQNICDFVEEMSNF